MTSEKLKRNDCFSDTQKKAQISAVSSYFSIYPSIFKNKNKNNKKVKF